jgi:hypothetical protein
MIWMDDDYMGVQHFEHGPGEKPCWLTPNDVLAMFHRTAWDAAQAGAFLFGWARSDIRNYMDWRPFQMLGVPRGCIGVLDGFEGLGYHPELTSAGDYWQALLCLYHHRYMWMDNRYRLMSAPDGKYAENRGGEATNRTLGSECKDFEILQRYFGSAVVQPRTTTGRLKQVQHECLPTLIWPWPGA